MPTLTRRTVVGAALPRGCDALLVTKLVNVRYLTGFTGSNGAVLLHRDGSAVLATDGRYATQAQRQAPDVDVVVDRAVGPALVDRARVTGVGRLGVERHHLTLSAYDVLAAAADGVELVDGGGAVERARIVKDDAELAAITAACAVTDAVFAAVLEAIRPGVTERAVARELRAEMDRRGARPAFEGIVAFGPNSAEPHHEPTDRELARGDLVKLDFGAEVDGYCSDMTRTVVSGTPAQWQADLHALVRSIQADARAATVPGARPVALDEAGRTAIVAAGHEVAHGLGHGVGLEIHESPFLVPGSPADTLVERVPVTVEPGIYLPDRGGVRIEDTVVVRPGGAETLTTSPRDLLEI